MKTGLKLALCLLAIGAVYTQTACPTTNKFLNMLKNINSSIVLTNVLTGTNFSVCNEVWNTSGTCCDVTALNAAFDDKMKNNMKSGFEQFMGGLKNVGGALEKIQQVLSNKDDVKTRLTNALTANSTQFNNLTVDNALMMLGYVQNFKDDVEKFKVDGKDCFEATKQAAGKLFCYGCAGTTPTGMDSSDGSSGVTQESCNALLDKCFTTWRFMHRVGNMMLVVSILNRSLKSDAPPPKPQEKPAFGGLQMGDIVKAFMNCNSSVSDANCTSSDKANLCKANFNVMAPPKKANNDNMNSNNTAALPPPGTNMPPPARILASYIASEPTRRVLQTTTASGDVSVGTTGADLTKSITTPSTSASVDSTSTDSGVSKISNVFFGGILAVLASIALLN